MKHFLLITFFSILSSHAIEAQPSSSASTRESIYVHTDRENYLVGETMWFKVYSINSESNMPSFISKIAYIEILDENNNSLIQRNIKLEKGIGSGSVYIPLTLSTSGYKLRCYTRWMRNDPPEMYFEKFISVINPFTPVDSDKVAQTSEKEEPLDSINTLNTARVNDLDSTNSLADGYFINGAIKACGEDSVGGKKILLFNKGENAILQTAVTNEKGEFSFKTKELVSNPSFLINSDGEEECFDIEIDSTSTVPPTVSQSPQRLKDKAMSKRAIAREEIKMQSIGETNLRISQGQNQFSLRERVNLNIENLTGNGEPANLSISVRKIDSLDKFFNPGITEYFNDKKAPSGAPRSEYISEYEGQLITGTVTSCEGEVSGGMVIFLYNRGGNTIIYTSRTDDKGRFLFVTSEFIPKPSVLIQPEKSDDCFKINLDLPYSDDYSNSEIPSFSVSENDLKEISRRSVFTQVNNTMRNEFTKLDTLDYVNFFESSYVEYRLDDYTRFKSLETTFREYVSEVSVTKKKDELLFRVKNQESQFNRAAPLVLLDGAVVVDHNTLSTIDPNKIERIQIGKELYLIGEVTFYGVIGLFSKPGVSLRFQNPNEYQLSRNLGGLKPLFPEYISEEDRKSPKPDFRTLLYWNSDLELRATQEIEFYTSDVPGTYQGIIQGINASGELFSGSFTFNVK